MKKLIINFKIILVCLILVLPVSLLAEKVTVYQTPLRYTIDTETNTAEVSGQGLNTLKIHNLEIPDYIDYNNQQIPVTSIRNRAFAQFRFSGSLTIGNNVTSIGEAAFASCDGFTGSLTIGNSVTTIGENAFYLCSGFTGSLTIPNSVTSIGSSAFYSCSGFTGSLTIGNSVTTIGENAFYLCSGFTGSLTIPNSVTSIGSSAFYSCRGFTGSLTIPDSVKSINYAVFYNCTGFDGSLTIPNSVTAIGDRAFMDCIGLSGSLIIPDLVTSIGSEAFSECRCFTGSLSIPNSVTTIGDLAFQGCSGFTGSLTIGSSVKSIGIYAFHRCSGFLSVNCKAITPPSVSSNTFPETMFSKCKLLVPEQSLEEYKRHNVWKEFYENDFCGELIDIAPIRYMVNTQLKSAEVYGLVPNITSVTNLVIPDYIEYKNEKVPVTKIRGEAFIGRNIGGTLTIGNLVTSIEYYSFVGCGFTGSLIIPDSITYIGYYAFYGCTGFSGSLTISDSVETIEDGAFEECSGFKGSLTFGNSVKYIGENAFNGCNSFAIIDNKAIIPPILSENTFSESLYENCKLLVPDQSLQAYKNHDIWKKFNMIDVSGLKDVFVNATENVTIYNLSGNILYQDVNSSIVNTLAPDIYIIRRGNTTKKVVVK